MSKMSNKYNKGQRMILRFTLGPRIAHWTYAFSFLMLMLTGLAKAFEGNSLNFLYTIFGGAANAHLLHRVFGVILMSTFILMAILDWKNLWKWGRELFDWKKRDFDFIKVFPKEFAGIHADYPPQGYLNGGTKINSILQILCCVGFVVSGIFMWFPEILPYAVQGWMYPLHLVSVCLSTAIVFGHIFLAAMHPNAKGGLQGMITGYVPESYAREHHGAWLDEVIAENEKLSSDKKVIKSWDESKGKVF